MPTLTLMLAKNEVNPNDPSLMTWTISRVSIGILQSTGPENIYESRKSNFKNFFDSIVDAKKNKKSA